MKLTIGGVLLAAVLIYLAASGEAENSDLTFNLAGWKPLPQTVETVCSCPFDDKRQARCKIPSQVSLVSSHGLMDKVVQNFKSLFKRHHDEPKKSARLSDMLMAAKDQKPAACHIEKVISCQDALGIKIVEAAMTNQDSSVCSGYYDNAQATPTFGKCNNTEETFKAVSHRCNGKSRCSLSTDADEELESICECQNFKYLQVTYSCVIKGRTKRQSDSYLKGRQRAFSRLLMIGLYPTYFNVDPVSDPQAVPETYPFPLIEAAPGQRLRPGQRARPGRLYSSSYASDYYY